MRTALAKLVAAAIVSVVVSVPVTAQGPGGGLGPRTGGPTAGAARERQKAVRERLRTATPDERRALADRMKSRREGMTPDQREAARMNGAGNRERPTAAPTEAQRDFARALRDKRRQLREDVAGGKVDRQAAADELRAWLRDRRPKPSGGEG